MITLKKVLVVAAVSCLVAGHSSFAFTPIRQIDEEFFEVVQTGDDQEINRLLAEGADVNAQDENGYTALMLAAHSGNLPFIQALIALDANVNLQDKERTTALIFAAQKFHVAVAMELLEAGANVNVQDSCGCTALHYFVQFLCRLCRFGNSKLPISYFFGDKKAPIFVSICGIITELLKRGVNPEIGDIFGNTPLDLAHGIRNGVIRDYVIALITTCRNRYLAEKTEVRPILKTYMIDDICNIVDKY